MKIVYFLLIALCVIGAVGGHILGGKLGGPNIEQLKASVLDRVDGPLRQKFNEVAQQLCNTVENCINNYCDSIDAEIDRYLNTYQATVDEKIQEQKTRKASIEAKLSEIKDDMTDIDDRKTLLYRVNQQLDRIN